MLKTLRKSERFILIELLIVIAIIAAVVFVALDPLTRFRSSRDSARWSDVAGIGSAVLVDQVDNRGNYISSIMSITTDTPYMIGTDTTGCDSHACDAIVAADGNCVDLTGLVNEGYLEEVPVSPNGEGAWTSGHTGFTIMTSTTGAVVIQACESENTDQIRIVR